MTAAENSINRPLDALLEEPLSSYEIGRRITESGHVSGRVVIDVDSISQAYGSAEHDLSSLLIGNEKLAEVSYKRVGEQPSRKYSPEELANPSLREDDYEDDLIVDVTGLISNFRRIFDTPEELADFRRGQEDSPLAPECYF